MSLKEEGVGVFAAANFRFSPILDFFVSAVSKIDIVIACQGLRKLAVMSGDITICIYNNGKSGIKIFCGLVKYRLQCAIE